MWTLQDAKNRFSAVVDAALAGQPQQVSRRGKPAVVIMSATEYERMRAAARKDRGSFIAHLMDFPGAEATEIRLQARPRDVQF
ncbi:type II toxin-antitoxin system Phd/YefM family antitoxin [Paracoccus sp. MBLB3053]|uniref:Antitoxin n=1 Tax=Paracoccus aurantius TaxID=3073814 RepID=A0ABU2HVN4_9RHOB|nr:type II toxin-antitoxin system Phd/YefM family antitoxin [Paracoccus sp. MBLB3053]MDS9469109.1 type II toxin-antitoxin system Phd/YefM family antitoxin [Paracoccus sp. MBLB3053]